MVDAVTLSRGLGAAPLTVSQQAKTGDGFKAAMAQALQESTAAGAPAGVSTASAATGLGSIGANGLFATPEEEAAFAAELNQRLAAAGVDASVPIPLTVEADGKVVAKTGTPGKATIDALFAADPTLANTYKKIANTEESVAIVKEMQTYQQGAANASASEQASLAQSYFQVIAAIKAVGADLTLNNGSLTSASLELVLRQGQG